MRKKGKTNPEVKLVPIDYPSLRSVSGRVRLQSVALRRTTFEVLVDAGSLAESSEGIDFTFQLVEARWDLEDGERALDVILDYRVAAVSRQPDLEKKKPIILFGLACEWVVRFGLPDDFQVASPKVMADFAVANGQLNAHPYVRQLVQDLTGRSGWVPVVLPTFLAPASRPEHLGSRYRRA